MDTVTEAHATTDLTFEVVVHDKVNNGAGGYVNLRIDSPDLGNKNVQVIRVLYSCV